MIILKIGLEIRDRRVMSLCAIEDKTAVVVVASYLSVSRIRSFQGPGFTDQILIVASF